MSNPRESTEFSNNAPGFTFCEVVELLVCYDKWIYDSENTPELSFMERVNVVIYGLSMPIYPLLAILSKYAFRKHSKVAVSYIGLYRDVWIAAIASSTTSLATRTAAICVRFQGRRVRRVYVTMQITFLTRKSALIYRRGLRQRVASLTLNCNGDFAIRAYSITLTSISPRNVVT